MATVVIYKHWVKAKSGRYYHATSDEPNGDVRTACGRTIHVANSVPDDNGLAGRPGNAYRCYDCDVILGLAR